MPSDILTKLGEIYSTCSTYQDSGIAESFMHAEGWQSEVVRRSFSTKFIRPRLFRCDYNTSTDAGKSFVEHIVSDGDSVRVLHSSSGKITSVVAKHDLSETIRGAAGPSSYLVTIIADLLMPGVHDMSNPTISELTDASLVDESSDAASDSIIVVGYYGRWKVQLSINRKSYSMNNIFLEMIETEELRARRLEHMKLVKEHTPEFMADYDYPEDSFLSISTKIEYREKFFDDSLTVESIALFQ